MKKVLINGRFLIHRVTGVERYAREILLELDKLIQPGEIEMAIPFEVEEVPEYRNIQINKVGKLHNRLWEHLSLPLYARKRNMVTLNLCNVGPLLNPGIVCIHDVKVKATPQYFDKKFLLWYGLLFRNTARRGKKIITVSEFSKKEIIKYYGMKESRIIVIPNAWQHYERIGYDEDTFEKYGLTKENYFFSMGSMEPNKNFKWVAEVAKNHPLEIFAVSGSVNRAVFSKRMGFECPDNMKLLGYVSDEEAKTLMRDCKAFLFPTFYEGFGIPPLEAISAGCKRVVVSDTEVMHEIFGNHVEYVNPRKYEFDEGDLNERKDLNTVLLNYSWERSAKRLYELLGGMG